MPNILMFAPCDKVILSQEDNSPSLISILETVTINIPVAVTELPPETHVPMRWSIFSLWRRTAEDEGKLYQQRTQLVLPNGEVATESLIDFRLMAGTQRNIVSIFGFPIAPPGQCSLKLSLREASQGDQWREIADYPINVSRTG